ncbi:MAG: aminotransferase class IV, partial [Bdellovibrionales bacterium]|nr:aminotransferase class IV [Bdellovibrionales bacterium]
AEFVYGPFTDDHDWVLRLKKRLDERIESHGGDHIIRLTLYREQARGLISTGLISVDDLKIHLSLSHLDLNLSEDKMLSLRTCMAPMRPAWWPDYLKVGDYLPTILAQRMCMQPGDDDVLFVNPKDMVLATSVSNFFMVRDNTLYTAPTGPNVLAGTMRKKVIHEARHFFDGIKECHFTVSQLFKSDCFFGTNAIRGPFLIDKIDNHQIKYSHDFLIKFEAFRKRVLV